MKKILPFCFLLVSSAVIFATTTRVTPDTYVSVYGSAANGDTLLLDAGTYATALDFPVGKAITLKGAADAAQMPILTFVWTTTFAPSAGSSLILDGLDINLNANYLVQFPAASTVDKYIFRNCIIRNVYRCLAVAKNAGTSINEITIDNCILKDCGDPVAGYCLIYVRQPINNLTLKNSTLYNYAGEGIFIAQTNSQTNTFVFDMHNNTIYKSGKEGANFGWCYFASPVTYSPTSTYNISNNIINRPYLNAATLTRTTINIPAGSGTVTCKNNLVIDYPNFTTAPATGWDTAHIWVNSTNYFKDTVNRDFTLAKTFPYKGTDNNYLGDPRWWPVLVGTPVAIDATVKTITGFTANWNAVSDATGFYLDVATDAGFSSFVTGYNNKLISNVTSFAVTGLPAASSYYYRVRAYNADATSNNSNVITVVAVGSSVRNVADESVKISVKNNMIELASDKVIKSVKIINMKGTGSLVKNINATEIFISTSNFSTGIYVIAIEFENKIITKKIVVSK